MLSSATLKDASIRRTLSGGKRHIPSPPGKWMLYHLALHRRHVPDADEMSERHRNDSTWL